MRAIEKLTRALLSHSAWLLRARRGLQTRRISLTAFLHTEFLALHKFKRVKRHGIMQANTVLRRNSHKELHEVHERKLFEA